MPTRMDDAAGANPSGSPEDTAGVYRLGAQTYAVNRPWSEDTPTQITDETLLKLLPDANISEVRDAAESTPLVQETWPLFLYIALACLLLEALLCLPGKITKRQAPVSHS